LLQTVCNEFFFQLLSSQTTPSELSEIEAAETGEEVKLSKY